MPPDPASSPRLSRRAVLQAAAGVGVGLPAVMATDAFVITPNWLSSSRFEFASRGTAAGPAATLMQLSDLHMRKIGRLEEQLLAFINAQPPDLLLLTGDAFDTPAGLDVLNEFLSACPQQSLSVGILGNWEYRSGIPTAKIANTYEQHGGRLLVNDSIEVNTPAGPLRISGLDDLVEGQPQLDAATNHPGNAPHLLLAHCPGQRDQLTPAVSQGVDLILSGHTHGGQVAPFGIALVTPGGSGRYVRGWYRDQGPAMYVSRGLGTSTLPIRMGVTPEVVTIRWALS